MGRKRASSAEYAPRKKAKTRAWKGPYAQYRRANMKSYMSALWKRYPAKQNADTDRFIALRPQANRRSVTGLGDYRFSRKVRPSLGARAGAFVGDRLQRFIGNVTGLGDYRVKKNSLWSGNQSQTPAVMNGAKREVSITRREYLGDVITSSTAGGFSINDFVINPGNPETFPWLSSIASAFQEYRLDGMLFHFKTMSADALNSTNTALGSVIMATEYNPDAPLFVNKQDMENTEFSSSCKPSESMYHPIECARHESVLNELYVARGGAIPPGGTQAFYNFARFSIATQGFQAASVNIGELWVTYQVTLFKPIQTGISNVDALTGWGKLSIIPGQSIGPYGITDAAGAVDLTQFYPLGQDGATQAVKGNLLAITRVSARRFQIAGIGLAGRTFNLMMYWQAVGNPNTYLSGVAIAIVSGCTTRPVLSSATASTNVPSQNVAVNTGVAQARIEAGLYIRATADTMIFDINPGSGTGPASQLVFPGTGAVRSSLDIIVTEVSDQLVG